MGTRVFRGDFLGIARLDARNTLGDGSLRLPAYLSRVGVFVYDDGQGGEFRELRPPEEVFDAASIDSFRAVAVTVGHPAEIDPTNWRALAVGHVGDNVRAEDIYLAADLVISDASAIVDVNAGRLVELSCGYTVDLRLESGMWQGEPYDAVQTNIRGNHVGMGPAGWGRAGSSVRMLDGATAVRDVVGEAHEAMLRRNANAWRRGVR